MRMILNLVPFPHKYILQVRKYGAILCEALCRNYLEGGGDWKNVNKIEGRLDVKFNTYKGGITFSFFFTNWKSSGRVIRIQIYILTYSTIMLFNEKQTVASTHGMII